MNYTHTPVMVYKVREFLIRKNGVKRNKKKKGDRKRKKRKDGKIIIDATLGLGGHSKKLLEEEKVEIVGIDKDKEALKRAKNNLKEFKKRIKLLYGDFKDIKEVFKRTDYRKADGVLFDLGVSSLQIDKKERGFSYSKEAKLDMRMDKQSKLIAHKVVNNYSVKRLGEIIKKYGEESWGRRIAGRIKKEREKSPIDTTVELSNIIKSAIPKKYWPKSTHPSAKTFQAIRIEINSELKNLENGLSQVLDILNSKGRVVVISYHSLEDRIVKNKFKYWQKDCICPPDYPICKCSKKIQAEILTKKPITPTKEEIEDNPRARSAKMRVCEKI